MSRFTITVLLLCGATQAAAAQATVRGQVRNARTNEPMAGATVLLVGTQTGAIADSGGRYDISGIKPGKLVVRARFIGYEDRDELIYLNDGETRTLDFRLTESITTLGAVLTEAKAAEREVFEQRPNLGVTMLSAKVVSSIPRLGEADVLRAAQLLPGVLARNDFTAG